MGNALSAHRERRAGGARGPRTSKFATHKKNDVTVHDFVMATWPEDATHPLAQRFRRTLRMKLGEAELLARQFANNHTRRYFEWGSGGSSEVAAWRALRVGLEAHSVDSSAAWAAQLTADSEIIRRARDSGRLTLHIANIGQTVAWGMPANWPARSLALRRKQSSAYVDAPIDAAGGVFDLVLVDGRFRAACALKALQHATNRTRVAIHDFPGFSGSASSRPSYKIVLDWYDRVAMSDTLILLRPKPSSLVAAKSSARSYHQALSFHMLNTEH